MPNTNKIYSKKNIDGSLDYIVDLGSVIYNDKIVTLNKLIIPLRQQSFFTLPEDKNKYVSVNVYYKVETGKFVFDVLKKSDKPLDTISATAIANHLPIAQFVIRQSLGGLEVTSIYEYSRMAAFSLTKTYEDGDRGVQGPLGETGLIGYTGLRGESGYQAVQGETGAQGLTGLGAQGVTGLKGDTGYFPDSDLVLYAKFKSDDDVIQDYSVYERDFGWTSIGSGFEADPGTGVTFIALEDSSYTLEDGVVDNCHSLSYNGGRSGYVWGPYTGFQGFSGLVQAWVRIDMPPIPDFTYEIDPLNPLRVTFTETTTFFPTSSYFDIEDVGEMIDPQTSVIFPDYGDYKVTLVTTNAAGTTEKTKLITV